MTKQNHNVFLFDAIGAACSAFFLGVILVVFNQLIGMPKNILYILAAIAFIFMVNSFVSYKIHRKDNWKNLLKIIITGNSLYCMLTSYWVFIHINALTKLGLLYFILEILIIVYICYYEIQQIRQKQ